MCTSLNIPPAPEFSVLLPNPAIMRIYPSSGPFVPIASRSAFTHLLSKHGNLVGGFDASLPAYIDAESGTKLSRGQVRSLSLSFGHGLRNYGAKRGDTILVFSPNCLAYPVIILGGALLCFFLPLGGHGITYNALQLWLRGYVAHSRTRLIPPMNWPCNIPTVMHI